MKEMCDKWEIYDTHLTHDGYAEADILVNEYSNGHIDEYRTIGHFRVNDPVNGTEMSLVSVDCNIFSHPILQSNWESIEHAIANEVLKAQAVEGFNDVLFNAKVLLRKKKNQ